MENNDKYTIITVESYPFGWEVKHFYLPVGMSLVIGDVLTTKQGKQYRILDGKNHVSFEEIDLSKYTLFE
jgi:hypothetical protein